MISFVHACSARTPYRLASTVLLLVISAIPPIVAALRGPDWIDGLIGIPLYMLLTVITYFRLRDAALAGAWVVLMIMVFNVGPAWNGYHLGNLINLVPIVLAWTVKSGAGAHPRTV